MQRGKISWKEHIQIPGLFAKRIKTYIFIWKAKFNKVFNVDSHLVAAPHVQIGL